MESDHTVRTINWLSATENDIKEIARIAPENLMDSTVKSLTILLVAYQPELWDFWLGFFIKWIRFHNKGDIHGLEQWKLK